MCGRLGVAIETRAADVAHLGGALILTVSVIATGEIVRIGRYLSILLGIGIAAGVWFTDDASTAYAATATVLGLVAAGLSIPRGKITERFGSWDRFVR